VLTVLMQRASACEKFELDVRSVPWDDAISCKDCAIIVIHNMRANEELGS